MAFQQDAFQNDAVHVTAGFQVTAGVAAAATALAWWLMRMRRRVEDDE